VWNLLQLKGERMNKLKSLLCLFVLLLLPACPASTGGLTPIAPGKLAHGSSGVVFPDNIAGFQRGTVKNYDGMGRDVSVGYNLLTPSNPIAITVYIYPGPRLTSIGSSAAVIETARKSLTDGQFNIVKGQVMRSNPQATLVNEKISSLQFKSKSLYGRSAAFQANQQFAHRMQAVYTYAEVYSFGEWLIKFRTTHPIGSQASAQQAIEEFKSMFAKAN
jgi:hypothetical protein